MPPENQEKKPVPWDARLYSVIGCGTIAAVLAVVVAVLVFDLSVLMWWKEALIGGAMIGVAFGLLFPRVGVVIADIFSIFIN